MPFGVKPTGRPGGHSMRTVAYVDLTWTHGYGSRALTAAPNVSTVR